MWIGQNDDLSGEIFMAQSAGSFNIKTQPGGTSTTQFTVTQTGNVGIGTTSPNKKLVVKSPGADNGIFLLRNSTSGIIANIIETGMWRWSFIISYKRSKYKRFIKR